MGRRNKFKCIYVLLAPDRSAYVGQTSDPINRKSRYKTMTCKNQTEVYNSLMLHGYVKHEFKILMHLPDDATRDQLDFYESFYFSIYKEMGYRMLNLKSTGWNGKPGEISRARMSKGQIGRVPWNAGTKGVCKAWNKGLHITRKTYQFKKNGDIIFTNDLMNFCKENNLNYSTMVHFLSGKGQYSKQKTFHNYERI